MKSVALILRKKIIGENSMEELAYSLAQNLPFIKVYELPCFSTRPWFIFRNILYVKKIKADIYHIFSISEAHLACFFKKVIVTCHDVQTMNMYNSSWKCWLFKFMNVTLPEPFIDKVICISDFTRKEFIQCDKRYNKKVIVCHNPLNSKITTKLKEFNKTYPKILHIGTAYRKSLNKVIVALKEINCKLIVVGVLKPDQKELLTSNDIDYENYYDITFDKILELYTQCDIVSFCSSYEGFGMPLIEANKVGRPVLGSELEVFSEIAPNCYYVSNSNQVESIRKGIQAIMNLDDYREQLIIQGIENAKRFDIKIISKKYSMIYNSEDIR